MKTDTIDPAWRDEFFAPDGRRLNAKEREQVRRRKDAERPAQTTAPTPERPPVTRAQFEALQRAKSEGKALAAEKLQPEPDPNYWREELKAIQGRRDLQHRIPYYQRLADELDARLEAERLEAERRERIEHDPEVRYARDLISAMSKTANDNEAVDLTRALAFLDESGDSGETLKTIEAVAVRRNARWQRELEEKTLRTAKEFEERAALEVQLKESADTLAAIQKAATE